MTALQTLQSMHLVYKFGSANEVSSHTREFLMNLIRSAFFKGESPLAIYAQANELTYLSVLTILESSVHTVDISQE
jgi:hypothetical protein